MKQTTLEIKMQKSEEGFGFLIFDF